MNTYGDGFSKGWNFFTTEAWVMGSVPLCEKPILLSFQWLEL